MPTEVIMPKVDMDMETGTVAVWHLEEGASVEKGDALFDIETDKATMEVEAPASGSLHFIAAQKDDVIPIGGNVAWIFSKDEKVVAPAGATTEIKSEVKVIAVTESDTNAEKPSEQTSPAATIDPTSAPQNNSRIRATPLAKRIARLKGIDLGLVNGSGPRGRIVKADVNTYLSSTPVITEVSKHVQSCSALNAKSTADKLGISYSEIPVDRMRATIASRLTQSKSTVPHFYLDIDCNIDALLKFRKEINVALEAAGSKKLSINDMLIRASALSLAAVPQANASWAGDRILQYDDANISVAVAIEGGLITPVVKQAQLKNMQAISAEVFDLAGRARSGKLSQSEYQGGSFSISNLGMFGVKSFNAIINPPESMILAVGKAARQFVPDENGAPIVATILSVTLSCDHRVVDGAMGAKWLQHFQNLLENPILLTLDPATKS